MKRRGFVIFMILCGACAAQTPIDRQPVKELKPTGSLGTCGYVPSPSEKPFFQKLDPKEQETGSFMANYDIQTKNGMYVSWYGIVRGITRVPNSDSWEILLEHKYFDGQTDCHIMLVSKSGSGDFTAKLQAKDVPFPALVLVRVYGMVTSRSNGLPTIDAEFVREWPWMTFTFADFGAEDKTNSRWKKECKICASGRVYRPYPDNKYYRQVLGDPDQYGALYKP